MSRRALPPTTLLARIRHYFGLEQKELALYLEVSPVLVKHIEAGRRRLTDPLLLALLPLVRQLPPAAADEPGLLPPAGANLPGIAAADAAELDYRRRVCQQQLIRIGRELSLIEQRALAAQRWEQALPDLLQAAADPPPADPERASWLADWLPRQARPLPPAQATRWRLLQARRAALTAEVAALVAGDEPAPA
jgi:transcriptional regulator with XRE-family HTH domain